MKNYSRTSLVVQWLRIHLPMQGTQVQSLVREEGNSSLLVAKKYEIYKVTIPYDDISKGR